MTATIPAIEVKEIRKAFRLPHQQRSTVKEHFVHPFRRTLYERQTALDGISFDVAEGEFFGIIGPNGSGKSTLLKVIAGIYRQDSGEVSVSGSSTVEPITSPSRFTRIARRVL